MRARVYCVRVRNAAKNNGQRWVWGGELTGGGSVEENKNEDQTRHTSALARRNTPGSLLYGFTRARFAISPRTRIVAAARRVCA